MLGHLKAISWSEQDLSMRKLIWNTSFLPISSPRKTVSRIARLAKPTAQKNSREEYKSLQTIGREYKDHQKRLKAATKYTENNEFDTLDDMIKVQRNCNGRAWEFEGSSTGFG